MTSPADDDDRDDELDGSLQLSLVRGDSVSVYPLPASGSITIGRGEDNDVRIEDHAASRQHAVLHLGPPLEIEDLGGANGTLLRELKRQGSDVGRTADLLSVRGRRAKLAVGDAILIGGVVAAIQRAEPEGAPEPSDGVVVLDPAMKTLYGQVTRAAQSTLPVLLLGETGVGKDVVARALHRASPRAARPFVALHCAALPETLLEGELFGYEKGAFTGASHARAGLIESAEGGTIFLDEVGELPPAVQVKLLRVLEQREVLRLGARSPRVVDVRFVAATHRDLEARVADGTFREDLYFRLNGVSLTVPPLRERRAEILPIAERVLAAASETMGRRPVPTLAPATRAALEAYAWPGNVRELKLVVERALVLSEGTVIQPADLPPRVLTGGVASPAKAFPSPVAKAPAVGESDAAYRAADKARVVEALAQAHGNQTRAAEILGISRRTLVYRLGEYGIGRPRKRG